MIIFKLIWNLYFNIESQRVHSSYFELLKNATYYEQDPCCNKLDAVTFFQNIFECDDQQYGLRTKICAKFKFSWSRC
jgi:hypothetical protein